MDLQRPQSVNSFEPIIGSNPKVLILGSMPGVVSLQTQQYYANPRNAFWPIMSELFAVEWSEDYQQRVLQIKQLPVIIWDTLKTCRRQGSLDSSIDNELLQVNEILPMLEQFSRLKLIAFNGMASEKYFNQYIDRRSIKSLQVECIRLPSTSPAHARMSVKQKFEDWKKIRKFCD